MKAIYQEILPVEALQEFVHSFWSHSNNSDQPELMTIFPDSFFKIIFLVKDKQIVKYFMTGLWTEQKEFILPAQSSTFGCRLKILAPEFLIMNEVASLINSMKPLDLKYLNVETFDFLDFKKLTTQWEDQLIQLMPQKQITENKLRLSQLLYKTNGSISASEVSKQIFWTNRQINRYLNQYIGVSLKKYLNIQKCYEAYIQIREGSFFPKKDYFDQAHFIREVKKHTGETPTSLYQQQNDRFIQLKHIKEK